MLFLFKLSLKLTILYIFSIGVLLLPPSIWMLQQLSFMFDPPGYRFSDAVGASSLPAGVERTQYITQEAWQIAVLGTSKATFFTQNEVSHLLDVHGIIQKLFILGLLVFILWFVIEKKGYKSYKIKINSDKSTTDFAHKKEKSILGIIVGGMLLFSCIIIVFFPFFFETFHQVFFPQGNYAFSPDSVLIQTFPPVFWMLEFLALQLLVTVLAIWSEV